MKYCLKAALKQSKNYLNNKTRWATKLARASGITFRRSNNGIKIRNFGKNRMKLISDFFSFDKIAEGKFTRKTMVERMVLVRNFILAGIFMMALFFGKELAQMFVGMHRLQQHREQYCKH